MSTSVLPFDSPRIVDPAHAEVIIRPAPRWMPIGLTELWRRRELLFFLVLRDIKVRYKQTILGAAWAIIQPLATMLILTLFFGRLANMTSDGIPYPLFSFAGLLPWMFFVNGLSLSANSLVGNANLITKVYFPRLLMPIASVVSGLIDLALAFIVLVGLMMWYGIAPTPRILFLPIPVVLAMITSLGAGLWLSAFNVQFRDVKYTIPFLCQLWMFASPVAYPSSLLQGSWHVLYGLNPMAGVVEWFRWSLLGTGVAPGSMVLLSTFVAFALLLSGAWYFRSMERNFADLI